MIFWIIVVVAAIVVAIYLILGIIMVREDFIRYKVTQKRGFLKSIIPFFFFVVFWPLIVGFDH
jgi:hypothetical protein